MTSFVYNDGGRAAAGFKGETRDCVCRSIAIATGLPYQEVYNLLIKYSQGERTGKRKKTISHPRTGIHKRARRRLLQDLGWKWVPTMQIGTGCQVHLDPDELPSGRLIVEVSKHCTAVIDGVIHDTHDPSRDGTRCVYGVWLPPGITWQP